MPIPLRLALNSPPVALFGRRGRILICLSLAGISTVRVVAQGTVPAGTGPYAVAVNPETNKVYVANNNSGFADGCTLRSVYILPSQESPV
jgi:DNA-binding beta-propeller fold protein YncE